VRRRTTVMMMWLGKISRILFVVFAVTMTVSYLGAFWWGFELLSHLRVQFAVGAAIFAVFFLVRRVHVEAVIAVILIVINIIPLFPYLIGSPAALAGDENARLRVMTFNLHQEQADLGALRHLIRREKPDFVLITEFRTPPARFLRDLDDILPYRTGSPRAGLFRLLLLSRLPIAAARLHKPSLSFLPVLEARLCRGSTDCFTLLGLHAARPSPAEPTGWRDAMLAFVAARAAASRDGRVIVIGDLNATPWSPVLKRVMKIGGLRDAAIGSPFRSTWTSRFPLLGLPLDQVLIGRAVGINSRRVAESIGSDHFPVIADLTLRAAPPAQ
jgi:endonuclease/exonuclease/phosphatase (EEP) superfamily protein YafD